MCLLFLLIISSSKSPKFRFVGGEKPSTCKSFRMEKNLCLQVFAWECKPGKVYGHVSKAENGRQEKATRSKAKSDRD